MIMDEMAKRRKRKEEAQRELMQKGLKLNYSNLPVDVKAAITATTPMPYIVEETVKLTWDGRQFILRIPKEIAEEVGITEENQIRFKFTKFPPESNEKPKLEISVV
jgi:hypothetical protein